MKSAFCCSLLLVALLPFTSAQECSNVYPHLSCGLSYTTETECVAAGCCWDATPNVLNSCFAPKINGYTFTADVTSPSLTSGTLALVEPSGMLGPDFTDLTMAITQETADRTHIKIAPPTARWEIPESLIPRPGGQFEGDANTQYIVSSSQDDPGTPMELYIARKEDGEVTNELIFILSKMLVFQDQYLEFVLGTPPDNAALFGMGESTRAVQQLQVNSTYTLWNTDIASAVFDAALYGTHPFLIQISATGKASGIMFMNSNAMDVSIFQSDSMGNSVGVQSTGGIIDLYVFAGPTPADVVRQFLEVVGKPAMVPYWSLGFHNCKWGYLNTAEVVNVVANYSAANIPLETQWVDIDYMDKYLDFTLDPTNFQEQDMTALVNSLHANDQYFVPIVDPGIYVNNPTYPAYARGMEQNVYVKDLNGVDPYLGQVWPGPTYFPDWFAENTTSWWSREIAEFHELLAYDGIWIDMNEVANFCNINGGDQVCTLKDDPTDCPDGCCLNCTTPQPSNTYDFPPFLPHVSQKHMAGKTMSMASLHAGGILEYNSHSLYGYMESVATRQALVSAMPTRPFLLSRSTFLGSGAHTAHWTGDNAATWNDLAASIVTMNNMGLFGMPMIGADICGFIDDTTEELCGRWIAVGAFSPFSRDHNIEGAAPQELYRWDSVAEASRFVLGLRYQLLPHLYTLMYLAHQNGDMVLNAMWTHFTEDLETLSQDGQYMWSNSLLFTPVLKEGATTVTGYFPKSLWYSMTDEGFIDASETGQTVSFDTPINTTNVHVRGGSIIPMQQAGMTTKAVKESPYTLLVALDSMGTASGSLFLDDGVQNELTSMTFVEYTLAESELVSAQVAGSNYASSVPLQTVEIRGVDLVADAECDVQLEFGDSTVIIPTSSAVTMGEFYATLSMTFQGVDIASDFVISWACSDNDISGNGDDDDDSVFNNVYVQIILSMLGIALFVGILFIGSKKLAAKKQQPDIEENLIRSESEF